jgi:MtrB/PioB family decaheme-associated outer membrane protein
MKRMILIALALPVFIPAIGFAEVRGEVNLGVQLNDFDDKDSAKFNEYRDKSDGVFGSADVLMSTDNSYMGFNFENPALDDQSYGMKWGVFGLFKGEFFYDELTHQLSYDQLTPATGVGSDVVLVPAPVPAVARWGSFDSSVEVKKTGVDFTVDTENPFYLKVSADQQRKEGLRARGLYATTATFELPAPIDYTTYNTMVETGYRSKETNAVLTAGYSHFNNENDLFTLRFGSVIEEYSTPVDNYSYNFSGRLTQRLPMSSLLAVKGSFARNVSEADFSKYLRIASPTADKDFDGDVRYIRGGAILTSQWNKELDTRLFYNYVNRDNQSEEITTITGGVQNNHLFEYDKHQTGLEGNYRLNKANKLGAGYELAATDRNREDADQTIDNLLFAEYKNSTLDWMSTKLRLEYLNRSSDVDYDPKTLVGDGLIHSYFTPFDNASKDRYKGKLAFEFNPLDSLGLGLSYALVFDDYDATQFGMQEDKRHEFYADANVQLPAKIRLNTYGGYEFTQSEYDARRFNPGGAALTTRVDANNYNWSQEITYDFFVVGGRLNIPVMAKLELVLNADHQLVDGNIDFARSAAAGAALGTVTDADDYYKTMAGIKGIYKATDQWSFTLGYGYEKSNLTDWKYENFAYRSGTVYLSGAGLDSDYEVHQVYAITTYKF